MEAALNIGEVAILISDSESILCNSIFLRFDSLLCFLQKKTLAIPACDSRFSAAKVKTFPSTHINNDIAQAYTIKCNTQSVSHWPPPRRWYAKLMTMFHSKCNMLRQVRSGM